MDRPLFFSPVSRDESSSSHYHQQSQPQLNAQEHQLLKILRGTTSGAGTGTCIPLPSRLYSILSDKHSEHIISWLPQGRAFRIHNVEIFAQKLLPLFVNINTTMGTPSVNKNLRVFTSQLEAWGFRELSRGPNSLAYYSELFVRDAPEIHHLMRLPRCLQQRCQPTTPQPSDQTTTRHHHHSGDLALLARAASSASSSSYKASAAATQVLQNISRNNSDMAASSQRRSGPLMDVVPPSPREELSLAQLEFQMSEALRVAKELHDRTILHLREARRIAADSCNTTNSSCSMSSSSPYRHGTMVADVAPNQCLTNTTPDNRLFTTQTNMGGRVLTSTLSPTIATTNKSTPLPPAGKKSSTTTKTVAGIPNKKKNRKKWLPPLGPSTPSSITATFLPSSTSSSSRSLSLSSSSSSSNNNKKNNNRRCSNTTSTSNNDSNTNTTTTTSNNNTYDWYYTNPEVFATLANKA